MVHGRLLSLLVRFSWDGDVFETLQPDWVSPLSVPAANAMDEPPGERPSRSVGVAEFGSPPLNAYDESFAMQFPHAGMALGDLVPVQAAAREPGIVLAASV